MASDTKVWTDGYKTGWCLSGCHEGVVKKSPSGKEFPSCLGGGCSCYCHSALADVMASIEAIARETGMSVPTPPTAPPDPTPTPASAKEPVVATLDPGTGAPARGGDITEDHPVNVESIPPRLGPPMLVEPLATVTKLPSNAPLIIPTLLPNGRRAPGSLEREIEQLIKTWGPGDGTITPKVVGESLNASPGAVSACWARWEKDGKCELGRKPARFVRFLK